MKNKRKTMKDRIIEYMEKWNSITTFEAFRDLGCSRLSEYIRQIRLEREVISKPETATNRYGEKVNYLRFYLGEPYESPRCDS